MKNQISIFFDLEGKLGRVGFLIRTIIIYILSGIIYLINWSVKISIIELAKNRYSIKPGWMGLYNLIIILCALILVCSAIILQIRRLNDLDRKRNLVLLTFIPPLYIILLIYLILANGKEVNTALNNGEAENKDININDRSNSRQKTNQGKRAIVWQSMIIVTLISIISITYYNMFYNPYNGEWKGELYNRSVTLSISNGYDRLYIYPDEYKVVIFEKNKRNTTIGIDGRSHNLKVSGNILILELNDLYHKIGKLDEDIYLKKVKKKK